PTVMTMPLSLSCKSIEPGCIQPEDVCLLTRGEIARVILDDFLNLRIAGCEQADRPIRAEHKAICSEGLKRNIQIWTKSFGVPIRPISLGNEARQFAVNISIAG